MAMKEMIYTQRLLTVIVTLASTRPMATPSQIEMLIALHGISRSLIYSIQPRISIAFIPSLKSTYLS